MRRKISVLLLVAMLLCLMAGCKGGSSEAKENVLVFSRSATIAGLDPMLNNTGMNIMEGSPLQLAAPRQCTP